MIMKFLFLVSTLILSSYAGAEVSAKNLRDFSFTCYKLNKKIKNYPQYCACVKHNLRWLVEDKDWNDAMGLYSGKMNVDEKTGLTELEKMIVDVELACVKNIKYIAPKAKTEKAKK